MQTVLRLATTAVDWCNAANARGFRARCKGKRFEITCGFTLFIQLSESSQKEITSRKKLKKNLILSQF
jgi:hypothetical protein